MTATLDPKPPAPGGTEPISPRDLVDLPPPVRPWRRTTLAVLALLTLGAGLMAWQLRADVAYALGGSEPLAVEDLGRLAQGSVPAAAYGTPVSGRGLVGTPKLAYSRPFDGDTFWLAPVDGDGGTWVELRVPRNEGAHYVPLARLTGRLIPVARPGLRHSALIRHARASGLDLPESGHILVEGEMPATVRWSLALLGLLVFFAGFGVYGLQRLLRPAR